MFVSNAVFVSYDETNGNARIQPDLFIAFGVDAAAIRENLLLDMGDREGPGFRDGSTGCTAANGRRAKRQGRSRIPIVRR